MLFVIPSEARNLSFFHGVKTNRDSMLRSEWQNKFLFPQPVGEPRTANEQFSNPMTFQIL